MLEAGSIVLTVWCGISFFLASLIMVSILFFKSNAPLLAMVFKKTEISGLDARVVTVANSLAILYNSCAAALSVLAAFVIWSGLINGQRWAFWALLITIGFTQVLSFISFAPVGNQRWQVNGLLSALYAVGIGIAGFSIFR